MARPRKHAPGTEAAVSAQDRPKTTQRTYRFDTELFEGFEEDCARHLANPKLVISALILHWMNASADERAAIAKRHQAKFGSKYGED